MKVPSIIDDERLIDGVYTAQGARIYRVDHDNVTRIEPYAENGQLSPVPCLRIWQGEHLHARIMGLVGLDITYADPPEASSKESGE